MTLKNKIRALERLLRQPNLSADVKKKKEEELNSLREQLPQKAQQLLEQKLSKKYRMVKFFELRKVTRRLKSVEKKLQKLEGEAEDGTEAEIEELRTQKQRLLNDLEYVTHYPADQKYVALYAPVQDPAQLESVEKKREQMRLLIKQRLSSHAAGPQAHPHSRSDDDDDVDEPSVNRAPKVVKTKAEKRKLDELAIKKLPQSKLPKKLAELLQSKHSPSATLPSNKGVKNGEGKPASTRVQMEHDSDDEDAAPAEFSKDAFFLDEADQDEEDAAEGSSSALEEDIPEATGNSSRPRNGSGSSSSRQQIDFRGKQSRGAGGKPPFGAQGGKQAQPNRPGERGGRNHRGGFARGRLGQFRGSSRGGSQR